MEVAGQLRGDPRVEDFALYIRVVDESGAEIHREHVCKGMDRQKREFPSRA